MCYLLFLGCVLTLVTPSFAEVERPTAQEALDNALNAMLVERHESVASLAQITVTSMKGNVTRLWNREQFVISRAGGKTKDGFLHWRTVGDDLDAVQRTQYESREERFSDVAGDVAYGSMLGHGILPMVRHSKRVVAETEWLEKVVESNRGACVDVRHELFLCDFYAFRPDIDVNFILKTYRSPVVSESYRDGKITAVWTFGKASWVEIVFARESEWMPIRFRWYFKDGDKPLERDFKGAITNPCTYENIVSWGNERNKPIPVELISLTNRPAWGSRSKKSRETVYQMAFMFPEKPFEIDSEAFFDGFDNGGHTRDVYDSLEQKLSEIRRPSK
ncbi:MAG TPA: hypothetical protein DDW52_06375 [Planctomycetaceae bacterium]|nr:hypothetical protein [Planctomycetaceae bacterium]